MAVVDDMLALFQSSIHMIKAAVGGILWRLGHGE